ncbi:MAG: saccharopine dehydrogenase NADP-binding domain-containing protein, partial [Fimbriimonas sp.]
MNTRYVILGAGMQGTAAAYDLAKFAQPHSVTLADYNLETAQKAAERVNKLLGSNLCHAAQADATSESSLFELMQNADILLSCIPYYMHPKVAKIAVATKTNMLDL